LTDGEERDAGSNPLLANTDGDLFSDFIEVQEGSDPSDPDSIPNPQVITRVNRYSFSETDGTTIIDSIGGANGTIIGTGFTQNGNSLSLFGGASSAPNAAYVDLPNNLVSVHEDITVEAWFALDANQGWSRIFDFGSSDAGELFEHGGIGNGQDYILASAQIGGNINQQRWEIRTFGGAQLIDTNTTTTLGEEFHIAFVFDADGNAENDPVNAALVSVYRDGIFLGSFVSDDFLSDILDDNIWLGRSNWLADANTAGTYNEVRIYDAALREAQVTNSFLAGPDSFGGGGGGETIKITDIQFDETTREVVLTWTSRPGAVYSVDFSADLTTPFQNIEDGVTSGGETTTKRISVGALTRIFLTVREE
ncbi:MAG: LamG domain-containing protein, partial [Verrucomicrobiales bacterium]|nr:LamG domain-containing protein [Verrucomicrobiales bacterium]